MCRGSQGLGKQKQKTPLGVGIDSVLTFTIESVLAPQRRFLYYRVHSCIAYEIPLLQSPFLYYMEDSVATGVHSGTTEKIPLLQSPFLYCIGESFTTGSILVLHGRFRYYRVNSGPFLYYRGDSFTTGPIRLGIESAASGNAMKPQLHVRCLS